MQRFKKQFVWMILVVMALQLVTTRMAVYAYSNGDVVINEVAWAGTAENSNDEWIELYNNSNSEIDLSGWYIEDDGSTTYLIESGTIAPHGYFLIEDAEDAVSNITADAVLGLSLANSGDSLVLKDADGNVIDSVNAGGGAWYAGDSTSKATMERVDPLNMTDSGDNWANALSGNGSKDRAGNDLLGTPGGANSNFSGGFSVDLNVSGGPFSNGDSVMATVEVAAVNDLYAYGMEINYDPTVLNYVSATEADFLKADGESTAFYAALENGNEGKLIIGNARLISPAAGIDGNGELFGLEFVVVGNDGDESSLNLGAASYLADSVGDLQANFSGDTVTVGQVSVGAVQNLEINEATEAYSLELSWDAPTEGADSYIIKRMDVNGDYLLLAQVSETSFIDADGVTNGGNIVPNLNYQYQVIAMKNGSYSAAVEMTGMDSRGITGDNDRSLRVDGRDVENLARAYTSSYGEEGYDALVDTTYDGIIDGSDLIDIGANFGVSM